MSSTFYLSRYLSSDDKIYTEAELIAASNYVVVLAEPGGGKTELMRSLAQQLGTTYVTAGKFVYGGAKAENTPLVIDAFDELSKVGASGIYQVFGQAKALNPTHVYLSSRSSEWDNAVTNEFNNFFSYQPLIVRLCEFDEDEQRAIFEQHIEGEDFSAFRAEVARFDLEALLPNPQFLKLFADAYMESERHFINKRSIFELAVERLAKEVNPTIARINPTLSTTQKVDKASEVFTKLLLSGAEGVCTSEAAANRMFPLLASLMNNNTGSDSILATRLFKPGDSVDQHTPIHKIVAEYRAAHYLTRRIADPADSLTLPKCLAVIAPNSIVRDELRGLLGWMAALGAKSIQESAIKLDPYAVLANGDPSRLESSSKRLLINRLVDIEAEDPHFRRRDFWRRFSVAGFFTPDVIEMIKPLLVTGGDGQLRDLILELLIGSPAVEKLKDELCILVLEPGERKNTRLLANRCLRDIARDNPHSDVIILISEASDTSLRIAAATIEALGPETFERTCLAGFFRACTTLYPGHQELTVGEHYFVKQVIDVLDLATTEWLLDELTKGLACVCGKKSYECNCRTGISKIVGSMLDRYFDLAPPPFDAKRVWQWVENLNFHKSITEKHSNAVKVLQKDDSLRQGIIAYVFGELTDQNEILEAKTDKFGPHSYSHSGLNFQKDDYKFVVDLAFETNNPNLWACFMARYQYHRNEEEQGPDCLRRHMREQALGKPAFMREWARINRATAMRFKQQDRRWHVKHSRTMERHRKRQEAMHAANIKFVQEHRELVESGRHWDCLVRFADLVLDDPDKIENEFGDETLVRNALRNCLDFITPHVPDLHKLAELQCASKYDLSEIILYAACLEIMRTKGNLEEVELRLLTALRTNRNMSYSAVSSEERDALFEEVDRLVFPDRDSVEDFLRQYIEPQLAQPECAHPKIWLLSSENVLGHLGATLSIEWLERFHELALSPLNTLFEIAAQHGNRNDLKEIIVARCLEIMSKWPTPTENEDIEQKRTFWLVRAWYFLDDVPKTYWDWLKADKDTVLVFYERSRRMNHGDHFYWPKLTSSKIEAILDAFIDKWPKVDLPNHWGTGSPKGENAYRFLTQVIWSLDSDDPDDAIPILERFIADQRFVDLNNDLKSIRSSQVRKKALRDFEPPTPQEIVSLLDHDAVVTVEGLRQIVIQELQNFQNSIDGGEFNSADRFYEKDERLDEVRSTEIIAERLNLRLEPRGISVALEHQLKSAKRCDFTLTKMMGGKRRLLVTEVKGQWHNELYTAAATQLRERYSIHPDAEQQGIFVAIWFGPDEKVAGRKRHGIKNAQELRDSIETHLPQELTGLIDVFVLDVSKPQ